MQNLTPAELDQMARLMRDVARWAIAAGLPMDTDADRRAAIHAAARANAKVVAR